MLLLFFGVTVIAENLQNSNKNFCNRQTACSSGFSPKETRGVISELPQTLQVAFAKSV